MSDIKEKVDESFNMYNSQFEDLEEIVRNSIEYIHGIDPCISLGNIGSDASKVIKIIYDYYKEKGINFDISLTFEKVIDYIYSIALDAKDLLLDYIDEYDPGNMFTGQIREKRKHKDSELGISCLEEYRYAEDQILCFDLDSDLIPILDEYLDIYPMKGTIYRLSVNSWIDYYNKELEQLGLSNRIDYRLFKKDDVKVKRKID